MNRPDKEASMTIVQSMGFTMGTVPNNPKYGTSKVNPTDASTANSRNLLLVNPILNAFLVSDRQFQTTINSCRVARIKAIVRAYASFSGVKGPGVR